MSIPFIKGTTTFKTELSIEEAGELISQKLFGGLELSGLDKQIYDEVPAIYIEHEIMGLRVVSGQKGGWIMKAENIQGLTPKQIQAKFALPAEPNFVVDVNVPTGTKLRCGIANEVPEWSQPGGGFQFDTMGQWLQDWGTPRDLN